MSTLAYATLTERREATPAADALETQGGRDVKTYIDAMAALVPAEVLALHALFAASMTDTKKGPDGKAVTTITDPGTFKWCFWGLVILSIALYLGKKKGLKPLDLVRAAIPALAFVG